jgi:hypothetical protein
MTNTTHWLDNLSDMFRTYQTSSGDEGFTFSAMVTAAEFAFYMAKLFPFVEARAEFKLSYDATYATEYGLLEIDCWDREQGEALAAALQDAA